MIDRVRFRSYRSTMLSNTAARGEVSNVPIRRASHLGYSRLWATGLLVTAIVMSINCCASYRIRKLSSALKEEQVVLFGAYRVDVNGVANYPSEDFSIECDLSFVTDVDISMPHDSIPILIIDSICFLGACINDENCHLPMSYDDWDRETEFERLPNKKWEWREDADLAWDSRHIFPLPYMVRENVNIPLSCQDAAVTARVVARLLDRVTKRELSRESMMVPVWIRERRSYYPD